MLHRLPAQVGVRDDVEERVRAVAVVEHPEQGTAMLGRGGTHPELSQAVLAQLRLAERVLIEVAAVVLEDVDDGHELDERVVQGFGVYAA